MNILDRAKDVAQAAHEQCLELSQRIVNLHSDIVALVEENGRLNDENKELKETLRLKREMKYKEPFYFVDGDDVPFCPACWESKSQPVHLLCLGERAVKPSLDLSILQTPLFGSESSPCRSCFSFLRGQGRSSRSHGIVEKQHTLISIQSRRTERRYKDQSSAGGQSVANQSRHSEHANA